MSDQRYGEELGKELATCAWYAWVDSRPGCVLLDGGLGSILSARGHDLSQGSMWSGTLLHSNPEEIRTVAWEWLSAGSDIITTATYQVSEELVRKDFGLSSEEAKRYMITAWDILEDTRNRFWSTLTSSEKAVRRYPKIAISLGPLSAVRADTNEYSGLYENVSKGDFRKFHQRRASLFAESLNLSDTRGADILCYETIGNADEALAIVETMSEPELRRVPFWISFQCRDDSHLASGVSLSSVVHLVLQACLHMNLVAIGVNCVETRYVDALVGTVRASLDRFMSCNGHKHWRVDTLAYPNGGESYIDGSWIWASGHPLTPHSWARNLRACNAKLLGGCCRTFPSHVSALNMIRSEEQGVSAANLIGGNSRR